MAIEAARRYLEQGRDYIESLRWRKAAASAGCGLESLRNVPASAESVALLEEFAGQLLSASEGLGKPSVYAERLAPLFAAGLRRGRAAEDHVRALLRDPARSSGGAIEDYVCYLEANGSLPEDLRTPMNQVLSYALHVRLTTPVDEAKARAPWLERIHRCRPKLTFPRLFLGRLRYLERDYGRARELLEGISGRLASNTKVLNVRGRCAEKLGKSAEALELYSRSLAEDQHQPHVHFRIGRLMLARHRKRAAGGSGLLRELGTEG